jgi:hypothetical protein
MTTNVKADAKTAEQEVVDEKKIIEQHEKAYQDRLKKGQSIKDPILQDLYIRYNMSEKIWNASNKNCFPYNFDVWYVCLLPTVACIFFILGYMQVNEGYESHLQTIMLTFAKSVFAYWISDKLILTFNERLRDKGLFGRDLNKAGIQKYKKPVPEALGIVISIVFLVITI